jgi:hypothetical protein
VEGDSIPPQALEKIEQIDAADLLTFWLISIKRRYDGA